MRKERPSKTARKVALNIVTLGAKSGMEEVLPAGIVDATASLLVESGAAGSVGVRWSRSRKMVYVYKAFDWMMPGQFEAFAHRKAFCERQVRKGIEAGASQVLVLGAGYDTIGWRLAPEFTGVEFFEIDHPATACLKAKGISAMGERPNLHLIAEDLGKRQLMDVMQANEMLDAIGLDQKDDEGFRVRTDNGERLRIEIQAVKAFLPWPQQAEMVAEHWKTIGIQADVKEFERGMAVGRTRNNEHQIMVWTNGGTELLYLYPVHAIPVSGSESFVAPKWGVWYASNGEQGVEPDDPKMLEIYDLFRSAAGQKEAP